ncbi:hypothetical protein JNB71_03525 [Rhizobium herbae]|uniref:Uncharacterized protein n=1 Tax=Rhizobium herbae TaxID=508661 RepID=A0ABS7H587_9HYPH|nr:hypothetical protein [Rhizobium herbae]MBW9062382.1 hypothetical protein [Rhizobium herbae]
MAENLRWKVLRRHDGDRMYEEGEIRTGTKAELGHLSPRTLELIPAELAAKAERAVLNKAERPTANKAATGPKAK